MGLWLPDTAGCEGDRVDVLFGEFEQVSDIAEAPNVTEASYGNRHGQQPRDIDRFEGHGRRQVWSEKKSGAEGHI